MTKPMTTRSALRGSLVRSLGIVASLSAALTLSACGVILPNTSGGDPETGAVRTKTAKPSTAAPAKEETPSSVRRKTSAPSTAAKPSSSPSPTAKATWSNPSIKFYNEDTSIWYQNDDVVNLDAAGESGNIEGYITNNRACFGYVTRDTKQAIWALRGDDKALSETRANRRESIMTDYSAQDPVVVDLVRDDNGTMAGYERVFSTTVNFEDVGPRPYEGYRFDRVVGDYGFEFAILLLCEAGSNLTVEQWHQILSGVRLEGIDAGAME